LNVVVELCYAVLCSSLIDLFLILLAFSCSKVFE
jgi:hypothetical protein